MCQWSPGHVGGGIGGAGRPAAGAARCRSVRVRTIGDDADDDHDGDGDVPTDRSAAAPLRLAVLGAHGGALVAGRGTGAWRVAGYPLTLGGSGRGPSARAAIVDARPGRRGSTAGGTSSRRRIAAPTALAANRYTERWCSTIIRYGVPAVLAPCTCTAAAPGLVGDPPAEPAEAPAQVDVLHVHEVALVPAPDRVDRGAAEEQHRARDPVDVAGPAPVDVELTVPTGEAVRGAHDAEQRVTDRVDRRRRRARADGYCEPSGLLQRRPDGGEVGLGVEARQHRGRGARRAPRGRGCTPRRPARVVAAMPRLAAAAYPRFVARRRPHARPGSSRRSAATEPSREPLSTTTISGVARARRRRAATARTRASNGPAS